MRDPCLSKLRHLEPAYKAKSIGRQRGEDLLEMALTLSGTPRWPHSCAGRGLRESALHALLNQHRVVDALDILAK